MMTPYPKAVIILYDDLSITQPSMNAQDYINILAEHRSISMKCKSLSKVIIFFWANSITIFLYSNIYQRGTVGENVISGVSCSFIQEYDMTGHEYNPKNKPSFRQN